MKYCWKICWFIFVFLFSFVSITFSAWFVLEVNPSNFDVNEAVDVNIRAINTNGDTIVDYDGIVMIELNPAQWYDISFGEYNLPSDGIVFFEAWDLWQKTFSKAFTVKKQGVYTLKVFDIDDETIVGQRDIIVWNPSAWTNVQSIEVVSPINWWVENMWTVNVIANAPDFPNSPYRVLLNNQISFNWISDSKGSISAILTWLQDWSNIMQIRILDVGDVIVAQSSNISFQYQSPTDDFFRWIQIVPFTWVKQWDRLVFSVDVSQDVSSVELLIWSNLTFPMDRDWISRFLKDVVVQNIWEFSISLRMNIQWNTRLYQDVSMINVLENNSVGLIKFYLDALDNDVINLEWNVIWNANRFLVQYWLNQDNLNNQEYVNSTGIKIENLDFDDVYYFQVSPVNNQNQVIWNSSDIVQVDPGTLNRNVSCMVEGIDLKTEEIDWAYYFVWEEIENVDKYIIYRSDSITESINDMQKVWETEMTRFEYPFDPDSLNEEFAYYAVVALCSNWQEIILDDIKRVQVWPYDTMLLALLIALLAFFSYKIYVQAD